MNYFTKKLSWLIMSMMLLVSGSAWAENQTGTITFSKNDVKINGASITADDNLGNTWTITTEGTTSFTGQTEYYQVGSASKPATSITFTTTLPASQTMANISAKFGGFNGTVGTISIKVDDTEIGSGNLNGSTDVTVSSSSPVTGSVITITITDIEKGVKCYYISYGDEQASDEKADPVLSFSESTATATIGESFTAPTLSIEPAGLSVTYSSSNTAVATVDASTGEVTILAVGTTTIKAISAETDEFNAGTVSYTLTVKEKPLPVFDEIDLTGKTESIIFSDFKNVGRYADTTIDPLPASNNNAYNGWVKEQCMCYSQTNPLLQLKASLGEFTSPTIKSDKGIKVIVKYGSGDGVTLTIGDKSVTGEALGTPNDPTTIVELSSTSTNATFTLKAGNKAAYVKSIEIVPLTGDEIAAPTFSPDGGEFTAVQTVTITAADGCTILYSLDGSAPSIEYSSPITISETATLKAIAKDVAGNESDIASATYTINIPVQLDEYANIKALIEAAPSKECILNLKNAQVLYVGKNDMYVKDATGAIDFFKTGLTYTAGQILNGTINVTYKLYNNLPEITAVSNNNLTATNGTATPVSVDVEEIGLSGYVCDLITTTGTFVKEVKEGTTTYNYYISDGANQIPVYNKFSISDIVLTAISEGANVTATGIVVPYNGEAEIALTALVVNDEPIVNLDTYENIAALEEAAPTEKFILELTNAQVLYSYNKDTYIKDATGAILFYGCELPYTAGQVLNGTITATYKTYKGIPEIDGIVKNNLTAIDGTVSPVAFDINAITVEDNVCDLVSVTGTFVVDTENNKYYVSDGTNQIVVYNGRFKVTEIDEVLETIEDGANVTATGIVIPQSVGDGFVPQIALTALESSSVQYYGDANGDGSVDISDVVVIVNYILNSGDVSGKFVFENADVDNSETVDISDVVGVVNMILNGELKIRE